MPGNSTVLEQLWKTVEDGVEAAIILARATLAEALEHEEPEKQTRALELQDAARRLSTAVNQIPRRRGPPPQQQQQQQQQPQQQQPPPRRSEE